ncbi:MAG: fimbria/pilus outer membrane usher protein [Acidithiobacillus ferrivorans]
MFASNTINDSFAIVDTNGFGNIRVLDENRLVGRTDSAGQLLVPDLRSYDVNHLAIDPNDVPITATLPYATRNVRPPYRSGVVVKFPISASHAALGGSFRQGAVGRQRRHAPEDRCQCACWL